MRCAAYPARNALKGKLETRMQYRNCMIPDNMRKKRNASIVFNRVDVVWLYAFHKERTALLDGGEVAGATLEDDFEAGI